jgi:hypothetical protein
MGEGIWSSNRHRPILLYFRGQYSLGPPFQLSHSAPRKGDPSRDCLSELFVDWVSQGESCHRRMGLSRVRVIMTLMRVHRVVQLLCQVAIDSTS